MDMPVSPVSPAAPATAPQVAPAPAPQAVASVAPGNTSVNDGQAIAMPTVSAPTRPRVEGEDFVDKGDASELEILHAMVGEFKQGDRILVADLGEHVDMERLVRLGAVKALKEAAPAPDSPPSKSKAK
jgi:hypothetical protein